MQRARRVQDSTLQRVLPCFRRQQLLPAITATSSKYPLVQNSQPGDVIRYLCPELGYDSEEMLNCIGSKVLVFVVKQRERAGWGRVSAEMRAWIDRLNLPALVVTAGTGIVVVYKEEGEEWRVERLDERACISDDTTWRWVDFDSAIDSRSTLSTPLYPPEPRHWLTA